MASQSPWYPSFDGHRMQLKAFSWHSGLSLILLSMSLSSETDGRYAKYLLAETRVIVIAVRWLHANLRKCVVWDHVISVVANVDWLLFVWLQTLKMKPHLDSKSWDRFQNPRSSGLKLRVSISVFIIQFWW